MRHYWSGVKTTIDGHNHFSPGWSWKEIFFAKPQNVTSLPCHLGNQSGPVWWFNLSSRRMCSMTLLIRRNWNLVYKLMYDLSHFLVYQNGQGTTKHILKILNTIFVHTLQIPWQCKFLTFFLIFWCSIFSYDNKVNFVGRFLSSFTGM